MNKDTKNFINGGLAGILSRSLTSPLEILKLILQNNPQSLISSIIKSELKQFGVKSLFKGNLINCIRIFPQKSIKIFSFEKTKPLVSTRIKNDNINNFISGGLAGVISNTTIYPFDTIRSKLSVQNKYKYYGIIDCVKTSIKQNGILSLYNGIIISTIGQIPFQGSNFGTYYYLKKKSYINNTELASLCNASVSGLVSVGLTYPFDTIKRKLQLKGEFGNPVYKHTFDCIKYNIRVFGLKGLYSGFTLCLFRIIPTNGFFFLSLEYLNKIY